MQKQPFVIERTFKAPIGRVWDALTDKDKMKQWYFDLPDFQARQGFEFSFYGGSEEKQYLHRCKVTEVVPGKKLAYSWRYEGYPGDSQVVFELFEEGEATRVKLTHEGLETFASDNPDMAPENFAAGWTEIIAVSLKAFVEA